MAQAGIDKPDTEAMLETLKPFQRDTVDYVFRRLYKDTDYTRRFLVADEVGLGKTLIARGVIARAIDHLAEHINRIDIVYICSNADIARQNLQRLNLTDDRAAAQAGRLTMLPAVLPQLDERLNFIAFTPGTSFEMGSSTGKADERRLLFWMLSDLGRLPTDPSGDPLLAGAPQLFQGGVEDINDWRSRLSERRLPRIGSVSIDATLLKRFDGQLERDKVAAQASGATDLQTRLEQACRQLQGHDAHTVSAPLHAEMNAITGELRQRLAHACVSALEPDLVILDEFQRFKNLLDADNEAGELAHALFNYDDEQTEVRTLLLSATPYKMYTLHSEQQDAEATEDHYRDFMDTLDFLFASRPQTAEIESLLKQMRRALYRIPAAGLEDALGYRAQLETRLREVMVRTERASGANTGDDMLEEARSFRPDLQSIDAGQYLALQRVVRAVDGSDMLEYWKSAPYPLNFMDSYQVKQRILDRLKLASSPTLTRALSDFSEHLLDQSAIRNYQPVAFGNGRLRALLEAIKNEGLANLLWLPPSLTPYRLGGPFAELSNASPTKYLIFSAWHVVPKTVAALVSYEVERQLNTRFNPNPENTPEARRNETRPLRLNSRNGEPAGLSLFTLLYPSSVLAQIGSEALARAGDDRGGAVPDITDVRAYAERLVHAVMPTDAKEPTQERVDESWYWVTPILLDMAADNASVRDWWYRADLAWQWTLDAEESQSEGWCAHLERARTILGGDRPAGRPPDDLTSVLADIAIAGPATCALRSLRAVTGYDTADTPHWLRDGAAQIGWAYRRLFNQLEATVLIRGEYGAWRRIPYWRQVLRYALDGGLTAVNDEYLHMLGEVTGSHSRGPESACHRIVQAFTNSVAPLPGRVSWDEFRPDSPEEPVQRGRLRTHFARRFGQVESEDGNTTHKEQVRAAFNSPFWPFVLASTSVGQEGLDFHPYCHAVVHWNLPNNPVDMEQREGRIHRYKGHAVRKNVATQFQHVARRVRNRDPWRVIFDQARAASGGRGLAPDWNYPLRDGARIQRLVPVLPLSRDRQKHERLRQSLAAYRMVFGQARQEDLVAYLLDHIAPEDMETMAQQLRIDLSPPSATSRLAG